MGQIGNVEKEFLRKERPLRNGKRYYLAILEKDTTKNTEPFGIYGNQGLKIIQSISVYMEIQEQNLILAGMITKTKTYIISTKKILIFFIIKCPRYFCRH